jgi:hypothetical protein
LGMISWQIRVMSSKKEVDKRVFSRGLSEGRQSQTMRLGRLVRA